MKVVTKEGLAENVRKTKAALDKKQDCLNLSGKPDEFLNGLGECVPVSGEATMEFLDDADFLSAVL